MLHKTHLMADEISREPQTIALLAWLNYRGVYATLNINFVITAIVFISIIILFFSVGPFSPGKVLLHKDLLTDLPYGWIGALGAWQFGMWYYVGIEGTCQAAEEVRSAGRSIPLGTLSGMITLLIAAALTWYIAAGLMPWQYLGQAYTPLYDAAKLAGGGGLQAIMFIGTLFAALASANGCINDASRAWFSMGRDRYMREWFGAVHPRYRTPYRAILFLVPIAVVFALVFVTALDLVIGFSILSGFLSYTFMSINMIRFRKLWPLGSVSRGYVHPFHPITAIVLLVLCVAVYFATYLGYTKMLLSIMVFYILAQLTTPEHTWLTRHVGGVFMYGFMLIDAYRFAKIRHTFFVSKPAPSGAR